MFFKNLYSPIKDCIEDDFENEVGSLSLKIISSLKHQGINVKASAIRHTNGKNEGIFEPEFHFSQLNHLYLKAKLRTTDKLEGTLSGKILDLEGYLTAKQKKDKQFLQVGVNYLNKKYGSFNLKITSPNIITNEERHFGFYGACVLFF